MNLSNSTVVTSHLGQQVINRMDYSIPGCSGESDNSVAIAKLCERYYLDPANDAWLIRRLIRQRAS